MGLTGLLGLMSAGALAQNKDDFSWIPEEAKNAAGATYEAASLMAPVVLTPIPKVTADKSKFTKQYTLDLKKFGIFNDGTHPVETSRGINDALKWAAEQGKNYILFPPGTYLIDENNPIVLTLKNTIVDLNGATLKINPNGLKSFHILRIAFGAENLRLTNGKFVGDMDKHDYASVGGHAAGNLLVVESGIGLEIDHLDLSNAAGFCISTKKGMSTLTEKGYVPVSIKNIEAGGFNEGGQPIEKKDAIRTIKPLEFKNFDGEFEFGYIFGYGGYASIFSRNYQAYFYDADKKFIKMGRFIQFKKAAYPKNAKYVQLEFNQASAKEASKIGIVGSIQNMRGPVDVHFHHNYVHDNRSLGLAFCGGQRWIIENNTWVRNGGSADVTAPPRYAIDFEDGWELMQDVVVRHETFKDNNQGDLVVCGGSELLFEDNKFEKNAVFWGRTLNYTVKNNEFHGGYVTFQTRTGAATITDNVFKGAAIHVDFDKKLFNSGMNIARGESAPTPPLALRNSKLTDIPQFYGAYIVLENCVADSVNFVAKKDTRFIRFVDSTFTNSKLTIEEADTPIIFESQGNQGEPEITGKGVDRLKN